MRNIRKENKQTLKPARVTRPMYQDNLMPSAILTLILGERETSEHLLKVHSCSAACNKSTRSTSPERGPKSPSSVSFAIEFLGNRLQVMSILKHI